jgi:hypothetical protein
MHSFLRSLSVVAPGLALVRAAPSVTIPAERFKAQRAPTEQVLSSQFRLLCHLLEASD